MKRWKMLLTMAVLILAMLAVVQTACAAFEDTPYGGIIRPGKVCEIHYKTGFSSNRTTYCRINVYDPEGHLVLKESIKYKDFGTMIDTSFLPEKAGEYKLEGYCYIIDTWEQIMTNIHQLTLKCVPICETHTFNDEWTVTEEPTCTEAGRRFHTCTVCFEDVYEEIPAKGHQWDKPVYVWAEDNSSVEASHVCTVNKEHTEKETAATKASVKRKPTYGTMGVTTYTAVFVNPDFGTVTKDVEDIPQLVPQAVSLSKLEAGPNALTAKWKKGKDIDGYEIEYSLKKTFKGSKKVTISKAKTTNFTLEGLKSKKKYYVRIRTFKTEKGKKYYSEWSKALSKKTK